MRRPNLAILDVGHGNAAVLADTGGVVVIDCGKGGTLLDYLDAVGIKKVDVLVDLTRGLGSYSQRPPSHFASGPFRWIAFISTRIRVRTTGEAGRRFEEALRIGRIKKGLEAHTSLTMSETGYLDQGDIRIEVLLPSPGRRRQRPGGPRCGRRKSRAIP